jgi:uncharacterized DUF497 family protein
MVPVDEPFFRWNEAKNRLDLQEHGVGFADARRAFDDPDRVVLDGLDHSGAEPR